MLDREATQDPARGRPAALLLRGRRRALPLAVRGQPADRDARARGRDAASRPHPRGPEAHRRRPGARRATPRRRSPASRRPSASSPRSPGLEGGELRLASFPSASATLLTEAVSLFHRRHPDVRLSIADAEPEESLPRLRAGELDLALTFDYPSVPKEAERDLDRTLLLTESMHLALPADHPLASRSTVPLAELADMSWLCGSLPSTCGEVVLAACRSGRLRARGRLRVRRLQRHAGLHRRRARGDAAARPRAAHAPPGPGRPPDRPAGADAARLGRDPRRGLAFAGDRRDGRHPGRGRRRPSRERNRERLRLAA